LPVAPGLKHHLVSAGRQRRAQREHREHVARLTEGAEKDPKPVWGRASFCAWGGDHF
jgi:hypothetical protein